jgi:hypothetical protein
MGWRSSGDGRKRVTGSSYLSPEGRRHLLPALSSREERLVHCKESVPHEIREEGRVVGLLGRERETKMIIHDSLE